MTETFGRDAGTFGEDTGGLTAVSFQDRIVPRQPGDQFTGQRAVIARGQGEPDVGPFPHPIQQAAITQQLQVARQPRLRLTEDFGELHDAECPPSRQREQAEAGRFSGGAQTGEEMLHSPLLLT